MPRPHDVIRLIRQQLDDLEAELRDEGNEAFLRNFDALEVPDIVASIADHLQPVLVPHEAVIYWHLFRKSVLACGQQYVRASTSGLTEGIITSSRNEAALSLNSVKEALRGLERKGAILKAGETNQDGTLYKVCLPEEIPLAQERMKAAAQEMPPSIDQKKELDYYNVRENRLKIFERDGYLCKYCSKQLTRFTATLDHLQPVSERGNNSYDNLVTACLHCNSRRGSRPVMDALVEKDKG